MGRDMRRRGRALLFAGALASLLAAPAGAEDRIVLLDFETGEPSDGWKFGGLSLAETGVEDGATPSGGRALRFVAKGEPRNGRIGYARHDVSVSDWRSFDALVFHAKVDADAPVAMRVMAYRAPGPAARLRRFTLEPGDWREVVLPLRDFRDDTTDQVCDFSRIDLVLFRWDATPGSVTIDDIALVPGKRAEASAEPTVADRMQIAFPDGDGKAHKNERFLLLTNAKGFNAAAAGELLARCDEGLSVLRDVYGVDGTLGSRAPLIVFETREQFSAYIKRLGTHFGIGITPPRAAGLAALDVAASSWSAEHGWDRPTFVHEATHAAIRQLLGVTSSGNWLQEGLANAVQLRLYPGSAATVDFVGLFEARAEGKGLFVPFAELFAKSGAPSKRYTQYISIMDFLADQHTTSLPAIWKAVRGLRGRVHKVAADAIAVAVGTDLATLEADWAAWGAEYYRGRKDLTRAREKR